MTGIAPANRPCGALATVVLLALLVACAAGNRTGPEAPPMQREVFFTHYRQEELGPAADRLPVLGEQLDGIGIYINTIIWLTPGQLEQTVAWCKQNGIKILIECGHFDWVNDPERDWMAENDDRKIDRVRMEWHDRVGEETARMEIAKIGALVAAGGKPDYISMDGTIRRMLLPGQDVGKFDLEGLPDLDAVLQQMVAYMRTWREAFPDVQFLSCVNFPNWGWRGDTSYWNSGMFNGDYAEVFPRIIDAAEAAGVPFDGVVVDYPYEYFTHERGHDPWGEYPNQPKPTGITNPADVDWQQRLFELEEAVLDRGLNLTLIINSEHGGAESDQAYSKKTLEYLDAYLAAGGRANRITNQSWYPHPKQVVPEDEPYTGTYLTREMIRRLR